MRRSCVLVAPLWVLAACNDSPRAVESATARDPFKVFSCAEKGRLKPRSGVDYIDVRQVVNGMSSSVFAQGTPCRGAAGAACDARLRELEQDSQPASCTERRCPAIIHALTTERDRVEKVDDRAAMLALLATIDTPFEAWLLAMIDGHVGGFGCDAGDLAVERANVLLLGPTASGTTLLPAFQVQSDGFLVRERWYSKTCDPIEITEDVYRVTRAGAISAAGSRPFHRIDACVAD